jgi:SH3-like domain-containing protein
MLKPLVAAVLALLVDTQVAAQEKTPPYWASIVPSKARIRTGPGRNFPAIWLYQRRDLPVKVIGTYPSWRKIQDPDGAQGWMQSNMLSDERTGMVKGGVTPMRARPDEAAPIVWRAEPGVVGRLRKCRDNWCDFDVNGRRGWIEAAHLWGVAPGEAVED